MGLFNLLYIEIDLPAFFFSFMTVTLHVLDWPKSWFVFFLKLLRPTQYSQSDDFVLQRAPQFGLVNYFLTIRFRLTTLGRNTT